MEVFHRGKVEPPAACDKCRAPKPVRILSAVAAHVASDSACAAPSGQCGMQTGQCGPGGCAF